MCVSFGNMCTCIYCVLYCFVMCMFSYLFCLYCHRVTTQLQLIIIIIIIILYPKLLIRGIKLIFN
jgi:lipopolysaccharide export LptBFGC system permease protein LptF